MTTLAGRKSEDAPAQPVQLFASSPSDPRFRRPVDAVLAVIYLFLVIAAAAFSVIASDLDGQLSALLVDLPGFLQVFWLIGFWGALAWALALLMFAIARGRLALAGESLVAAIVAVLGAAITAAVAAGELSAAGDLLKHSLDANGPPTFPAVAVAMSSAVLGYMGPYVTRPVRRLGRCLVAAQVVGALFLGVTQACGAVASVALGFLAGELIHVVRGSPGGLPTVGRVRTTLAQLGVHLDELEPVEMRRAGVVMLSGRDGRGEVAVKVYGRDAWEGEFLASLWQVLWYRGRHRTPRPSRAEFVEHEAFMTYLAGSAGLRVGEVVTAGLADNGDAIIVTRPDGVPLAKRGATLDAGQVACLWRDLDRLHDRGICHRRIDLDRVVVRSDGSAGFGELFSASVRTDAIDKLTDGAQLLALTTLVAGRPVAVEQARAALGDDRVKALLPYLQEAALPPAMRDELEDRAIKVDDVRDALAKELGTPDVDLVRLRRVTWKSLLNLGLLLLAAYTIITLLGGLDLAAVWRELQEASVWWLLAALVMAQLPRVTDSFSTMGSTPQPLPFGPTVALHFATCYINLAVPSSAARLAVTTRFFQRCGIPPASALTASAIDSFAGFVVQVTLFVLLFAFADVNFHLSTDAADLSGLATIALIVVIAAVIAIGVVLFVPSIRRRVRAWLAEARSSFRVLRMPAKLVQLFGGNLLTQVLFAVAMSECVAAFGQRLPLSELILINSVVSLFAGLLPIPGGVGVSEAGITLGLTAAGINSDTAFAIAVTYRFATFYLPPIWGFQCYRWLVRKKYL